EEIRARSGSITQSTVSKALKQLEEDVVVWREKGLIKLLQADKLLDKLVANFKQPRILEQISGKLNADLPDVPRLVSSFGRSGPNDLVMTGASSVTKYGTMSKEPVFTFYCNGDLRSMLGIPNADIDFGSRFPNFRLVRTDDSTAFFDVR